MKKLTLNLETLGVESFETAATTTARGTVQAHDATQAADTCGGGPRPSDGCSVSCPYTYDGNTNTIPDQEEPYSNNCWTVIVF